VWKRGGSLDEVKARSLVSDNQRRVLANGRFAPVVVDATRERGVALLLPRGL
jgi:hypothetical protein